MIQVQEGEIPGDGKYLLDYPDDWKKPCLRAFFSLLEEREAPIPLGQHGGKRNIRESAFCPFCRNIGEKMPSSVPCSFIALQKKTGKQSSAPRAM